LGKDLREGVEELLVLVVLEKEELRVILSRVIRRGAPAQRYGQRRAGDVLLAEEAGGLGSRQRVHRHRAEVSCVLGSSAREEKRSSALQLQEGAESQRRRAQCVQPLQNVTAVRTHGQQLIAQ
jgi:hypothetical protein